MVSHCTCGPRLHMTDMDSIARLSVGKAYSPRQKCQSPPAGAPETRVKAREIHCRRHFWEEMRERNSLEDLSAAPSQGGIKGRGERSGRPWSQTYVSDGCSIPTVLLGYSTGKSAGLTQIPQGKVTSPDCWMLFVHLCSASVCYNFKWFTCSSRKPAGSKTNQTKQSKTNK